MIYGSIVYDECIHFPITSMSLDKEALVLTGDVEYGDLSAEAIAAAHHEADHHIYASDGSLIYIGRSGPLLRGDENLRPKDRLSVTIRATVVDRRSTDWIEAHSV